MVESLNGFFWKKFPEENLNREQSEISTGSYKRHFVPSVNCSELNLNWSRGYSNVVLLPSCGVVDLICGFLILILWCCQIFSQK